MYSIKLNDEKYFTGSYAKIGKVQGGVDISTLPPTTDIEKAKFYKYDYYDVSETVKVPVIDESTGGQKVDENEELVFQEEVIIHKALGWIFDEEKYNQYLDALLQEKRNIKKQEINDICQETIHNGTGIVLNDETPEEYSYFSFTMEDQSNIKALYDKVVREKVTSVIYHTNGEFCRVFTADEIIKLYNGMETFKIYNTTLCNFIRNYINTLTTEEEINNVTFDINVLPEEYIKNLNELLEATTV